MADKAQARVEELLGKIDRDPIGSVKKSRKDGGRKEVDSRERQLLQWGLMAGGVSIRRAAEISDAEGVSDGAMLAIGFILAGASTTATLLKFDNPFMDGADESKATDYTRDDLLFALLVSYGFDIGGDESKKEMEDALLEGDLNAASSPMEEAHTMFRKLRGYTYKDSAMRGCPCDGCNARRKELGVEKDL